MLLDRLFGTYLGIEFREDTVIFSCMKNSLAGMSLLSSATFPVKDNDEVVDEIREYIQKQGEDIMKVFVSVPDRWGITKFTEVPSLKGKGKAALINLMKFEVERHVPYELEDISYDFLVLEERERVLSVVFVAMRNIKIDFVKEFLEKVKLKPDAITTSTFAVLNSVELGGYTAGGWQEIVGIVRKSSIWGKTGEANISLNVSNESMNLAVLKDGFCTRIRTFDRKGDEAEEVFFERIAPYLKETQSLHVIDRYNNLILTGEASELPPIKERIEATDSETLAIDSVRIYSEKLNGAEINGLVSAVGATYAGLGIGTYGMNLLPHKGEYAVRKIAPHTTRLFLVLIVVMVIAIFGTEVMKKKDLMTQVEQSIVENQPVIREIEVLKTEISELKKRNDFLQLIEENEITLEVLAELANVLPRDSWVTNLNYKKQSIKGRKKSRDEIIISGYAASSSNLIPLLEDSVYFEKVEFVGPIKKTRNKEQFKLGAQVVNPDN